MALGARCFPSALVTSPDPESEGLGGEQGARRDLSGPQEHCFKNGFSTSEIGQDLASQVWKDSDGAFWCPMQNPQKPLRSRQFILLHKHHAPLYAVSFHHQSSAAALLQPCRIPYNKEPISLSGPLSSSWAMHFPLYVEKAPSVKQKCFWAPH